MKMPKIKQSENAVRKAITGYLTLKGWEVFPINNAGTFRGYNKKGEKRFSFNGTPGVSDLYCIKRKFGEMWIETKATGGKPTLEQEKFIALVNSTPEGIAFWCDLFDMFWQNYTMLNEMGKINHFF